MTLRTVAGLGPTYGRGVMTNHWVDIKNADVIMMNDPTRQKTTRPR